MNCFKESLKNLKKITKMTMLSSLYFVIMLAITSVLYLATLPAANQLTQLFPENFESLPPDEFIAKITGTTRTTESGTQNPDTEKMLNEILPIHTQIKKLTAILAAAITAVLAINIFIMGHFKAKTWAIAKDEQFDKKAHRSFTKLTALETLIFTAFTLSMFATKTELIPIVFPLGLLALFFADCLLFSCYAGNAKTTLSNFTRSLKKTYHLILPIMLILLVYNALLFIAGIAAIITPYALILLVPASIIFTFSWSKIYINTVYQNKICQNKAYPHEMHTPISNCASCN